MKRWSIAGTIGAVILGSAIVASQAPSGHALFEQALAQERVEGNLQEAIRLYERVVAEFASDRALAARALVQVGLSYEKLGRDEAVRTYERVVRDFADQADAVEHARSRLAVLEPAVQSSPTPTAPSVQPLPQLSREAELLSVAPDGTKAIVMDYDVDVSGILAIHEFAGNERRLLVDRDPPPGYTGSGVWSPDGRLVAYTQAPWTQDRSELRVTTLAGQSKVIFRADGGLVRPVGWTPDGATLVIVVGQPDNTSSLGTLSADGGRFTPLRSFSWSSNRGGGFRLSPDGRFVAYDQGEQGLRDVHVLSLDGRQAYRITDHPADDFGPIWSPDGRRLAFISSRFGSGALWSVEVESGRPVGQPVKVKDGMDSARLIDWTRRGIFYGHTSNTWDLYTVTMDPLAAHAIDTPRQIPYSRTGRNVSPVWSPDGGRLAFVSSSASEPSRRYVVVMTPDGGRTREFLIPTTSYQGPQTPYDLRWFGDGRGLGFSGLDARGATAVFRLSLATGDWDVIPVPVKASWTRIEWNPDGTAFYFARHSFAEGNAGIFERGVRDDAERLVYRPTEPASIRSLEFSPDRRWLAVQLALGSVNTVTGRVVVVDMATGDARTVVESTAEGTDMNRTLSAAGWSPSGDLVVWRSGNGSRPAEMLLVPITGGVPRIMAIPASGAGMRPLFAKWSPLGRSMVLVRESRGAQTFVIENPLAAIHTTTASR